MKKKSEPKGGEQERVSETQSEGKQESEGKHLSKGDEERKESRKKSFLLRKCKSFPITMLPLLHEIEEKSMKAKPPEQPLIQKKQRS